MFRGVNGMETVSQNRERLSFSLKRPLVGRSVNTKGKTAYDSNS